MPRRHEIVELQRLVQPLAVIYSQERLPILYIRQSGKIAAFASNGYECHGGLSDLLSVADIVIDCSPESQ